MSTHPQALLKKEQHFQAYSRSQPVEIRSSTSTTSVALEKPRPALSPFFSSQTPRIILWFKRSRVRLFVVCLNRAIPYRIIGPDMSSKGRFSERMTARHQVTCLEC